MSISRWDSMSSKEKDRVHVLGTEKELHLELQAASISEWDSPTRLHVTEQLIKTSLTSLLSQTSISNSGAKSSISTLKRLQCLWSSCSHRTLEDGCTPGPSHRLPHKKKHVRRVSCAVSSYFRTCCTTRKGVPYVGGV